LVRNVLIIREILEFAEVTFEFQIFFLFFDDEGNGFLVSHDFFILLEFKRLENISYISANVNIIFILDLLASFIMALSFEFLFLVNFFLSSLHWGHFFYLLFYGLKTRVTIQYLTFCAHLNWCNRNVLANSAEIVFVDFQIRIKLLEIDDFSRLNHNFEFLHTIFLFFFNSFFDLFG